MKVAFFASNDFFSKPLLRAIAEAGHDCVHWKPSTPPEFDAIQVPRLLDWCDVAFFDFCHFPLAMATRYAGTTCRFVARMHGIEVYSPDMRQTDWSRVHLVLSKAMELRFAAWEGISQPASMTTLNIGTDVEGFRPFYQERRERDFGHNLCAVALSAIYRKGIYQTVQAVHDLLMRSNHPDWHLHVRTGLTAWKNAESVENMIYVREYIRQVGLDSRITFYENMMPEEEFRKWLSGMDILVMNTLGEGYCKAIADAMAAGVYALSSSWLGADMIWPHEIIFKDQKELVDKILEWDQKSILERRNTQAMHRVLIEQEHDEQKIAKQILGVIEGS